MSSVNLLLTFDLMLQVYTDPKSQEVDRMKFFFHNYLFFVKTKESGRKLQFMAFSKKKDRSKEQ